MSAVCVLTPIVIASWPAITAAVGGVAAALGFSVASASAGGQKSRQQGNRVETALPDSEVLEETIQRGQCITIQRGDGVSVRFERDERGRCSLCVSGQGQSKAQLKAIGDEVAGRFVQQFAYHKLVTQLKEHGCELIDEQTNADQSIRLRVRVHDSLV